MPTTEFFAYAPDALAYSSSARAFRLDPAYSAASDRVRIEVSDDDDFFDGDRSRNEVGEDANQTATVWDSSGGRLASGRVYIEEVAVVRAPDGTEISLHRIEIAGQNVGYVPSQPLEPGVSYGYVRGYNVDDNIGGADTRESFAFFEKSSVPCFGPGTMIETEDGAVPVEWLAPGQRVLTRDNGFQPIVWIGRTECAESHFATHPDDCPVRIPAGGLGHGLPTRDLLLTGDHRILIASCEADILFCSGEVLAPAKAWTDAGAAQPVQPDGPFNLAHILLENHEVILAHGVWVESLFTGAETLRRLGAAKTAMLRRLMGDRLERMTTARPTVTRKEARALLSGQALSSSVHVRSA